MYFVYVVALVDEYVSQYGDIQYVIGDMTCLDEVRNKIKQKYNIEFAEDPSFSINSYHVFRGITDNRCSRLVVKRINIF